MASKSHAIPLQACVITTHVMHSCDPGEIGRWNPSPLATNFIKRSSCSADCGFADSYPASVDFSDVTKLEDYYNAMKRLLEHGMFGGYPESRWHHEKVSAGWNVCHKTHTQIGGFTPICIFEGHSQNFVPCTL